MSIKLLVADNLIHTSFLSFLDEEIVRIHNQMDIAESEIELRKLQGEVRLAKRLKKIKDIVDGRDKTRKT